MNSNPSNVSETKIRREKFSVGIRRSDNETFFANQRKRLIGKEDLVHDHEPGIPRLPDQATLDTFISYRNLLIEAMTKKDVRNFLFIIRNIREIISAEKDPAFAPLGEFFDSNLPQVICECFRVPELAGEGQVIQEAVWIFSNAFASKAEHIELLISLGTFTHFVEILQTSDVVMSEHILWSLSNILGEDPSYRESFDNYNLWGIMFEVVERYRMNSKIARVAAWLFSNAMRGPPYPSSHIVP